MAQYMTYDTTVDSDIWYFEGVFKMPYGAIWYFEGVFKMPYGAISGGVPLGTNAKRFLMDVPFLNKIFV
jgi:hypothetical protein